MDEKQTNLEGAEPEPNGEKQQGTDWKAWARTWESRSKEWKSSLDEANKEIETLRKFKERAEASEAELNALKAEKERGEIAARVASEKELPVSLMFGDDEAEMTANAEAIKEYIKGLKPAGSTLFKDSGVPAKTGKANDANAAYVRKLFQGN